MTIHVDILKRLENRGLAEHATKIRVSRMTLSLRNAIIKALENGIYPAAPYNSVGSTLYYQLVRVVGVPGMTVCKGSHSWDITTLNFDGLKAANAAIEDFMTTDKVAFELKTGGEYPKWGKYSSRDNYGRAHVLAPVKKSISSIKEIAKTYIKTESYVSKIAVTLDHLRSNRDIWLMPDE